MPRIRVRIRNGAGEQTPTHHAAVPSMMAGAELLALGKEWRIQLAVNMGERQWRCASNTTYSDYSAWVKFFNNGDMLVREDASGIVSVVTERHRAQWRYGAAEVGWPFATYRIEQAPILSSFRYDGTADIPDLMVWVEEHGTKIDRCEVMGPWAKPKVMLRDLGDRLICSGLISGVVVIIPPENEGSDKLFASWPPDLFARHFEVLET